MVISDLSNNNQTVIDYNMANRTRSVVWEFFSKCEGANIAVCRICSSIHSFSGTTNLLKHLRAKHGEETAGTIQWGAEDGEEIMETDVAIEATATERLNESDSTLSPGPRSVRKNRSLAWNCFKKIVGSNVAECLFCGVLMSQENGTTSCLMKHFMVKHPDVYAMHVEGQPETVSFVTVHNL